MNKSGDVFFSVRFCFDKFLFKIKSSSWTSIILSLLYNIQILSLIFFFLQCTPFDVH